MKPTAVILVAVLLAAPSGASTAGAADDVQRPDPRALAREVKAIVAAKCLACHGQEDAKIKAAFDLRTRAGALAGGESKAPGVVPGDPARSSVYVAVTWADADLQMPPKANDRLTDDQVAVVRRWIDAGAPWWDDAPAPAHDDSPAGGKDGVNIRTSGGQSDDWTHRRYPEADVWAYRPVRQIRPPAAAPGTHPIDAFVNAALDARGLRPAPSADRRTLIRRVTLDLTGLPPAPAEIDAFVADDSPDAWPRLIDRLLASPHYGQRMAQHWLDVVRYADTDGYSNDYERPSAWRYRDYVVRAFNADKPYDRFVTEQVAGDELDPADPELAVAAGFLRMGPWEHTAMSVAAVTRQMWLDDVTNAVGVTFLAQPLNCCKCHDHKFDPLPTRDYYALQAAFAATRFAERPAPFLPVENAADFDDGRARLDRLKKDPGLKLLEGGQGDGFKRVVKKQSEYVAREAKRYEPLAFSVRSDDKPDEIRVLRGGSLESPAGDPVPPDVLSALKPAASAQVIPAAGPGRRLALARWIASPGNPLTARVIVNRAWQWHFGAGLVGTPNNFGRMGKRPSHPELLDFLASRFVDDGWSLKRLHRLILTSQAYQRSGGHPMMDKVREADPSGALLAAFPPRRLSAEEIRDAMLAVTGELSPAAGGPGVFPAINWDVAVQPRHIMGGTAPAYQPSPAPEHRNRRTLYAFRIRGLADPMLEVFNRPSPDASCELRDQTTVTPQVFALFNSQFAQDRAVALAASVARDHADVRARCAEAFRRAYGRSPTAAEVDRAARHVADMTAHHKKHLPPPKTSVPLAVVREMIEEQSGLPIKWEETLDRMRDYRPDLSAADVPADVRALADLCLVLLNSNEFVYVY